MRGRSRKPEFLILVALSATLAFLLRPLPAPTGPSPRSHRPHRVSREVHDPRARHQWDASWKDELVFTTGGGYAGCNLRVERDHYRIMAWGCTATSEVAAGSLELNGDRLSLLGPNGGTYELSGSEGRWVLVGSPEADVPEHPDVVYIKRSSRSRTCARTGRSPRVPG